MVTVRTGRISGGAGSSARLQPASRARAASATTAARPREAEGTDVVNKVQPPVMNFRVSGAGRIIPSVDRS